LISEALAAGVFPGEEPLGKRLLLGMNEKIPYEIIGVVGDIRHRALESAPRATMYLPTLETGWMNLAICTAGNPRSLPAAVRNEVLAIDPDQPIAAVRTMDDVLTESVTAQRYRTLLLCLFAAVALLLAGVGIYGVISYGASQRTRELGVRMALGAQSKDVLLLVLGQGLKLALSGVLLGVAGALALTRLVKTFLFGVSATDPLTFAAIALLIMAVSLLACWIPGRRATKIDPMVALRYE
jgi:putative ABC transport system permease protein